VPRVGIHDNLFDLGGDSILIIQIVSRAREAGLRLTPNQLFDHQTVATLADVAVEVAPAEATAAEQDTLEGQTPLAPMQAWFFEQAFVEPQHFNQSVYLEAGADGIDPNAAAVATMAILAHHDALRLQFAQRDGHWTAEFAAVPATPPFEVIDLAGVPLDRVDVDLRKAIDACQAGFDLSTGPLIQVRLFHLAHGRPSRLLVVAHHLVVDGVSWRIVLGDFSTAYTQSLRGEPVTLPAKTTSFRAWTTRLQALASDLDAGYWLAAARAEAPALPTDISHEPETNTVESSAEVTRSLGSEMTTALLQEVPRAYTTEITDVLLAGLAMTFQSWTGADHLWIDLEAHGREELVDDADTTRTVGWFTAQFPVRLTAAPGAAPGDVIKSVKEQLRGVPHRGAGFGVLRYLSTDAAVVDALAAGPAPQVLFNYFGQAGRVLAPDLQWGLVPEAAGGDLSRATRRPHLLEINAMITDGGLTVTWTFSESVHHRRTIEHLAAEYENALRQLVDQARATTGTEYTPSDFPAAGLDQKSLDTLISKLNR
jgi:non-ribosomal peptide synthase protein (TIGR01720 family)